MNCRDPLIAHLFKGKPEKNPLIPMAYLVGKKPREINAFLGSLKQRWDNWERKSSQSGLRRPFPRLAHANGIRKPKAIRVSLWLYGAK